MRECAPIAPPLLLSRILLLLRPADTPCRRFAFRSCRLGVRPVIAFDLRRLVVASAAAVEDRDHEAAADHKGEEDAKPHHQPAPRRHREPRPIRNGRHRSLPPGTRRIPITTNRKAQLLVPDITPYGPFGAGARNALLRCCSWYGRLALKSSPGALLRLDPNAARGTKKPQSEKSNLWTGSLVLAEGLRGLEHGYTHTPNISRDRLQGRHGREPGP